MKKKILIIGDNSTAKWHQMSPFDELLKKLLHEYEVTISTNYSDFQINELINYDVCISLVDQWIPLNESETFGILTYVFNGGGLLMIHQGISLQARDELALLARGKFIQHPEQCILEYQPIPNSHEIVNNVEAFSSKEEPYQCILDHIVKTNVFMEYKLEDTVYAAGWCHSYGIGKVVYLSPGHNLETFKNPMYQKVIQNSINWLLNPI